ncbi:MAG: isoprenylcysteine carboxylmethyltransferase family protein [Chloroflexi bacterium]|nr:isoprenylcysteine carboxylmethyltransferase family protein [Chloroflexota bacterium]
MTNSQGYLVCWGSVGLVWLVGALYNVFYGPKVTEQRATEQGMERLLGVLLFVLVVRVIPGDFWAPITFKSTWLWNAGVVILAASTLFTLWARWILGTLWASTATIKQDHALRTGGPYGITRHPIYTGLAGMVLGSMLMNGFGLLLPVLVVMLVFFGFKIRSEEALLTKTFGEEYEEYKQRVPQLVPGLSHRRS